MPAIQSGRSLRDLEDRVLGQIDQEAVLALHAALVRVPSINPPGDTRDAFAVVETATREAGYETRAVGDLEEMPSLIATYGKADGPTLCFNSHYDVVPIGERSAWTHEPFGAEAADGRI